MRPVELVRRAQEELAEVTGLPVEGAMSLEMNDEDCVVTVVALELERTPNTMDVLGAYEVRLSDDGELQGFKRVRRFHRSAAEDGSS